MRRRRTERRRDKARTYNRAKKIGISHGDFLHQLLVVQFGRCAICYTELGRDAHADHDHETGKFRGVLCRRCNTALGMFGDDPQLILSALLYLVMPLRKPATTEVSSAGGQVVENKGD